MFDSIGGGEILLIMLAILVLFGPKRIPDLAQSLGKGLREFRKAQQELQNNFSKVVNHEDMQKITGSLRDMQKDMQTSVQKLTGDVHAALGSSAPATSTFPAPVSPEPAAPTVPTPTAAAPAAPDQSSTNSSATT